MRNKYNWQSTIVHFIKDIRKVDPSVALDALDPNRSIVIPSMFKIYPVRGRLTTKLPTLSVSYFNELQS